MDWVNFYAGKRVFITGHTGFKGSWMCKVLNLLGAEVAGYALEPPIEPNLFSILGLEKSIYSTIADIRNLDKLCKTINDFNPVIVIHMAAQPLVRESYKNPVGTYSTNVMGTVNILEAVRQCDSVSSFINVTTDKVYKNNEWEWGYRETDGLDGYDPYSNSKSCSELVTGTYNRSFFKNKNISIATVRAGNVIGGGDFAEDRIIPDCVRSAQKQQPILVRNPKSIRPYQHVLEPVCAYLMLAANNAAGAYNIGPDYSDCVTTGNLVKLFTQYWGDIEWKDVSDANAPHEAGFLRLDSSKIMQQYSWKPKWNIGQAVEKTVEWYKSDSPILCMENQIKEYLQ